MLDNLDATNMGIGARPASQMVELVVEPFDSCIGLKPETARKLAAQLLNSADVAFAAEQHAPAADSIRAT